jgi:hypothetical protein
MECNKWEENGLLYVAGELDQGQQGKYKDHLSTCTFCSNELAEYSGLKSKFFSPELLSIQTSPQLDAKIMNLCLSVKPASVGLLGTMWIKRIVFSTLVFAFGAGAGGYFTFAYYHAKSDAALASENAKDAIARVAASAAIPTPATRNQTQVSLDSAKPNAAAGVFKKNVRSPSPATNSGPAQGIITVDLKKE